MALPSTVRRFQIELSDVDRGVYESIDLRAAQHPSETEAFLLTRVLAYALNHQEGIAMSAGLCLPDEPGVFARDLTGAWTLWIEIGNAAPDRISKGARACDQVEVWTYKDPEQLARAAQKEGVHRGEHVGVYALPAAFLDELAGTLDRNNTWTIVRSDGALLVTAADTTAQTSLERRPLLPKD
jgi:uncharacterized protein YaeQ